MHRRPWAVAVILTVAACGGSSPPPRPTVTNVAAPAATPAVPADLTIATALVWRHGAQDTPVWASAEITGVFGFEREPTVGEHATVLPLDGGPPLSLAVTSATKRDEPSDVPTWWEVELEPTTAPSILDAPAQGGRAGDYPFDAIVLYPAVPDAHLVARELVHQLPPDTVRETVTAAIDLDGDGAADALTASFCCSDRTRPAASCDYSCGETFRGRDGAWVIVHTSMPL